MKRHGLLSDDPEVAKRLNVGMVFQNGALFDSLTVGENVGFLLYEHTDLPHERVEVQCFALEHPMLAKAEHTHLPHDRVRYSTLFMSRRRGYSTLFCGACMRSHALGKNLLGFLYV